MLKSELRKIYLAKRKALSNDERANTARQISERFFAHFDLSRIKYLHIFLAIARHNEVETSFIVKRLWLDYPHIKTCVPCVDEEKNTLETVEYTKDSIIKLSRWGIPEVVRGKTVEATKIDAVIAPLVCFDLQCNRVGYGKGFYDRFLQNCRPDCLKIGLSFFPPVEKIDDVNEFDVELDYCVTPEKVYSVAKAQREKSF
jgi:5,10-methenyltetrahydrofolate synthetase